MTTQRPHVRIVIGAVCAAMLASAALSPRAASPDGQQIDFNRDIRPILSEHCFACHGPDEAERKADLRLDTFEGATQERKGFTAIVPGDIEASELIVRVTLDEDDDDRMPPRKHGRALNEREVDLLKRWVAGGAAYAKHWSYVKPVRPEVPSAGQGWAVSAIDRFIAARLEREGIKHSPEADRYALIRRVSFDLTGLPPTPEQLRVFIDDPSPDAYEKLVDRLLASPAYGERWATIWLDLARYADSAGYADDPHRTIWAYRDWVIRAINDNMPFDRFTIEQFAGDLLPEAGQDKLIATAFHRNTMTNSEGGTNDEEFRSVAIVDRVNTTMQVWMGMTMACAQCHNHKYDPISQEEFFRFYALLNNTADADRNDESPTIPIWTAEQESQKAAWRAETESLRQQLQASMESDALRQAQAVWRARLGAPIDWRPGQVQSADTAADRTTLHLSGAPAGMTALRIESDAKIDSLNVTLVPSSPKQVHGRFVRIEIPGKQKILSLAEVQAFAGGDNVARAGKATQSTTDYDGAADLAIDGNTNGHYTNAKSTTHTAQSDDPWWELDLGETKALDRIVLWNRTDGNLEPRLSNYRIMLLDNQRQVVWRQDVAAYPNPSAEFDLSGVRPVATTAKPGGLFVLETPLTKADVADALLGITVKHAAVNAGVARPSITVSFTDAAHAHELRHVPDDVAAILRRPADQPLGDAQTNRLTEHYRSIAPQLQPLRDRLAAVEKQLAEMKPATTVPVMQELQGNQRRETHIHLRGNFLALGEKVEEGVPQAFHAFPDDQPRNRLGLARWLVHPDNPLTARVTVNRYWEVIFGTGLVTTSEDFGIRGELPTHPELLDWLAVEFVESGWDVKHLLRLIVTSAAYRQSSRVDDAMLERDPGNRLLARGPRVRHTAEMVRDQALFVSGLLSTKMYGPPVQPPRPQLNLSAAFGSSTDWQTSAGEDRYRRGLYTSWRRSLPYPSMATFDAPNRNVCTVRRSRTNTPLQALVTMNDPVYVEASQALGARLIAEGGGDAASRADYGFRLCLSRPATDSERQRIVDLYQGVRSRYAADPAAARQMAGLDDKASPEEAAERAAWTVVANVLLNLDEMFMKR